MAYFLATYHSWFNCERMGVEPTDSEAIKCKDRKQQFIVKADNFKEAQKTATEYQGLEISAGESLGILYGIREANSDEVSGLPLITIYEETLRLRDRPI